MEEDFEVRVNNIICNLGNTNYDSIMGQYKMIFYFQEILLKEKVSSEDLLNYFDNVNINCERTETINEVLGEIGQNLIKSHKCKPIWEDLGESYLAHLTRITKRMFENGILFNECNCC